MADIFDLDNLLPSRKGNKDTNTGTRAKNSFQARVSEEHI
jgi:hypothetical protein